MSTNQNELSKYLSDPGMFHRLREARTLWIKQNVEDAYLMIQPLVMKPGVFPEQFQEEAIWVCENFKPDVDWCGDISTRTARFIDAVLLWREEI